MREGCIDCYRFMLLSYIKVDCSNYFKLTILNRLFIMIFLQSIKYFTREELLRFVRSSREISNNQADDRNSRSRCWKNTNECCEICKILDVLRYILTTNQDKRTKLPNLDAFAQTQIRS